jgi:hypothetical protein
MLAEIDAAIAAVERAIAAVGLRGRIAPPHPSTDDEDQADGDTGGEPGRKRTRSTRRRQDVPDLPRQKVDPRTIGRTYLAGTSQPSASSSRLCQRSRSKRTEIPERAKETSGPWVGGWLGWCGGREAGAAVDRPEGLGMDVHGVDAEFPQHGRDVGHEARRPTHVRLSLWREPQGCQLLARQTPCRIEVLAGLVLRRWLGVQHA